MRRSIRRSNSKSPIQDPHNKDQPITTPPGQILEVRPHERITGVSRPSSRRHNSANKRHNNKNHHQQTPRSRESLRNDSLPKTQQRDPGPRDHQEINVSLPALGYVVRVVKGIHGYDGIGGEERDVRGPENPGEDVPPAGVEGDDFTVFGASGDGRPVVDIC